MNIATLASILADAAAYAEKDGLILLVDTIHPHDAETIRSMIDLQPGCTQAVDLSDANLVAHARRISLSTKYHSFIVPIAPTPQGIGRYAVVPLL